jgi:AraC family transcriptional regulator
MTVELAAESAGQRPHGAPVRGGLAGWQVRKLNALTRGDLRQLTAAGLAVEVRLSPFHFNRVFSATMGLTPGRWLTRARVQRAQALLLDPTLSISEVAQAVGYKGPPQLTRAFRSHLRTTPSEYRRGAGGG